jgi:hypothetical protein
MRKLFLFSVLLPCVLALAGCPKKKADDAETADAEAEAEAPVVAAEVDAEVAPVAPVAPVAKNVADVARFPAGETALTDDDQKTVDLFVQARTGPKQGPVVALVKAGTDPFKIAAFQESILVTFPDPKDPAVTLMGWIPKDAFVANAAVVVDAGAKDAAVVVKVDAAAPPAPAPAAVAGVKCAAGQDAVDHIGVNTVCRKKCKTDKDCKTPTAGACANATTNTGKVTRVCAGEAP